MEHLTLLLTLTILAAAWYMVMTDIFNGHLKADRSRVRFIPVAGGRPRTDRGTITSIRST